MKTFIYVLVDPFTREWRYIGKTENPRVRLRNHCNERSVCHRSHWIQSVRRRGARPIMKILQVVPPWASWQKCEMMWIDHAIRSYWPITNGTMGGDGVKATAETRAKISASRKGQKLSAYQRIVCVKNLKRMKIGDKLPIEVRKKISQIRMGVKLPPDHCRRISESKRRVDDRLLDEILNRLGEGESQSSIARSCGVSQPTVCAINRRNRKFMENRNVAE